MQSLAEACPGSLGCPNVCFCSNPHSDIACRSAQCSPDDKSDRNTPVTMRIGRGHDGKQDAYQDDKIPKDLPLSPEKSHSSFGYILAYLLHAIISRILPCYPIRLDKGVDQPNSAHQGNKKNQFIHSHVLLVFTADSSGVNIPKRGCKDKQR